MIERIFYISIQQKSGELAASAISKEIFLNKSVKLAENVFAQILNNPELIAEARHFILTVINDQELQDYARAVMWKVVPGLSLISSGTPKLPAKKRNIINAAPPVSTKPNVTNVSVAPNTTITDITIHRKVETDSKSVETVTTDLVVHEVKEVPSLELDTNDDSSFSKLSDKSSSLKEDVTYHEDAKLSDGLIFPTLKLSEELEELQSDLNLVDETRVAIIPVNENSQVRDIKVFQDVENTVTGQNIVTDISSHEVKTQKAHTLNVSDILDELDIDSEIRP